VCVSLSLCLCLSLCVCVCVSVSVYLSVRACTTWLDDGATNRVHSCKATSRRYFKHLLVDQSRSRFFSHMLSGLIGDDGDDGDDDGGGLGIIALCCLVSLTVSLVNR
jgi:hypothetical protein